MSNKNPSAKVHDEQTTPSPSQQQGKHLPVKTCITCGVALTPDNAYSRSAVRFKPKSYCKSCQDKADKKRHNKKRPWLNRHKRYQYDRTKFFSIKVRRGKTQFTFRFPSLMAKHDFVVGRRLQVRYGRGHISPSSNFGKSVYVPSLEERDGKTVKRYKRLLCDECDGIVRYSANEFQICEDCGLIVNDRFNVIIKDSLQQADTKDKKGLHVPIPETKPRGDSGELVRCYDRYYARAYSKRLR